MNSLRKRKRLTSFQVIIFGFASVILIGALILMLPISTQERCITPFNEAIFTSTSAVCVTGLVVHDTGSYWSVFGQSVILLLIQIGGLGVVTFAVSFALLSGKKISLKQRSTMQEAIAAHKVGGIVRLTGFILKLTVAIEILGALVMMPVFCKDFGARGIWMAFFHSISAFCNAGFDVLGTPQYKYSSLCPYSDNIVINITVMLLIIVGGIGFLTWEDISKYRFHLRKYRVQSKVILVTTLLLILLPAVYFYFSEFSGSNLKERVLFSLFQAVTPRTAGFNTVNHSDMSATGRMIIIVLMLIGGSPGSTAGGMKTTTAAVLFANAISIFRKKEDTEIFGRRIDASTVKNAAAVILMYITLFIGGAFIISIAENLPLSTCLYETASAVGTVGLSLGITPSLSVLSQIVLMILMFLGRVGGLTLIFAAFSATNKKVSKLPQERIIVG